MSPTKREDRSVIGISPYTRAEFQFIFVSARISLMSCFRFKKVGDALDVSHVHLEQYLGAADYALHDVLGSRVTKPEKKSGAPLRMPTSQ